MRVLPRPVTNIAADHTKGADREGKGHQVDGEDARDWHDSQRESNSKFHVPESAAPRERQHEVDRTDDTHDGSR